MIFLSVCSTSFAIISAPAGIRSAGMGGAGIAVTKGLAAVPYNPAGLMRGGIFEARLGAGATDRQLAQLQDLLTMIGDPQSMVENSYADAFDVDAAGSGIIGLSVAKIGISALPVFSATAFKEENSTISNSFMMMTAPVALSLGHTFSVPFLPFGTLDVGANLKSVSSLIGMFDSSAGTSGFTVLRGGNGTGLDLGVLGELDIPALTKLSVGAVVRDAFQAVTYNTTTIPYTIAPGPPPVLTKGTESEDKSVFRSPTTWGLGAGATVPAFGTLLTADMVNVSGKDELTGEDGDTTMHFGVEQPVMMGLVNLRFGWATGENPYTTLGLGLNLVVASLDIAYITDGKDSKGNAIGVEISGGF